MSKPDWTHFIGAVEVFPKGNWKLAVKPAWEDFPFCRDYRLKLEGDLIFCGDDYDFIRSLTCFDKQEYTLKCNGSTVYEGHTSYPLDFDMDEDRCEAFCRTRPYDKYSIFDEEADEQYQLDNSNDSTAWESGGILTDTWTCRDNTTLLRDILIALLNETVGATYVDPVSTFFWNDVRPDLANIGTHNYVTAEDPNPINHIVIAMIDQMANDTNPDYPEYSWNEFMAILHDFWNVWWYVDTGDNKVRIEHIRWWEGIWFAPFDDLTTIDGGR